MRTLLSSLLFLFCFGSGLAVAAESPCRVGTAQGKVRDVIAAAQALQTALTPAQQKLLLRPLDRESAIRWSNLPVGITPRAGLRLGDLDATQSNAAHRVAEAALSACGIKMLDEVRLADEFLLAVDSRKIGWAAANYYMSILGAPSERTPWMLQIGGHHLAYNFTFNGAREGATPLFFGTEPIRFSVAGLEHEPLMAQSTAMSNLAGALAAHPGAKLSGTFTDVVKGVEVTQVPGQMPTGGTDSGFPQSYPGGSQDRGIRYGELGAAQQALVRVALESYASLPGDAITRTLVAAYEAPEALAATYVGYSGSPDLSTKGTYVRIDGPRVWMEFVVQPAVANPEKLHYHALWRDKQSDYGGELSH